MFRFYRTSFPPHLILLFLICCGCHSATDSPASKYEVDTEMGKELATRYCQSCHLLPDPSLLDKKTWVDGVLPAMGPRLGIFYFLDKNYPSSKTDPNVSRGFYPSQPIVNPGEWQAIINYYKQKAPDSLPKQQRKDSIEKTMAFFKAVIPSKHYDHPASCFVNIDTIPKSHQAVICDVFSRQLFRFNAKLQLIDSLQTRSPVVDVDLKADQMTLCNIGVLNPFNGKSGSAQLIKLDAKGKMHADTSLLFDKLARPVQLTSADLNQDGRIDYLVCEFGNLTGALSWMEANADGHYTRHLLRAAPGAIKAYINDYNHDGLPDIWVLFAQGDESIYLFTNKGHGEFVQQQLLRFPPVYGSSSFELDDFNKDGFPDILYTCGDNADYSAILKPYHGVYIYLNDGANHFSQRYFFPINGCYKAMARDFDGDGDLDIATISFFADYKTQPEEGFVYLENKGNFQFKPYSLPETQLGRWLTMNVADLDGDGRLDIILGNFSVAPTMMRSKADWKQGPPFMVLKSIPK